MINDNVNQEDLSKIKPADPKTLINLYDIIPTENNLQEENVYEVIKEIAKLDSINVNIDAIIEQTKSIKNESIDLSVNQNPKSNDLGNVNK